MSWPPFGKGLLNPESGNPLSRLFYRNCCNKEMADVNQGGFDEKAIEEDLKKLFELLKCKILN